ncbi:AAA family ATPase [archaeon]|nr:AAA family ATPase [archaeon]
MVSSGCRDFDIFLGKGFSEGKISLIYGPSASGKTTICLQTALEVARAGKVLFVDSENSFSVERLKQMAPDCSKHLSNVVVFSIRNYSEQVKFFSRLRDVIRQGDFDIIIIDTIGMHYRKALQEGDYHNVNEKMISMLRMLSHLAEDYSVPILMTNQVYSNMSGENVSVGGRMLKGFGKILVELKIEPRRAILLKPFERIFHFDIFDEGIRKVS